ncbi:MAG: queuosine precursor transporter [Bacteroidota bacterium]
MKESKRTILFLVLGSFFIANALIAEFIGVKIFSLETTFGFNPANINIFEYNLSFNLTAGVILWPIVFIMTDIINEYFGHKAVKLYSYIAASLITYSFLAVYLAMNTVGSDFWNIKKLENSSLDMNLAYNNIFGQGLWIIIGSLVAFLVGQVLDVKVFQAVRKITGEKKLWLRATISTLVSQLIDSFVVLFIAFYIGKINTPDQWPLSQVIAISIVNYLYKFIIAWLMIPVLYFIHKLIDKYLGKELAETMTTEAALS